MRHGLVRSFSFAGVPVLMHWSVFVIGVLIMVSSLTRPVLAIVVPAAYLGVLLLHEAGHAFLARRRRQQVVSIEVYPFFGLCRYAGMADAWDHSVVAWGGVLAQLIVAVPLLAYVFLFGYTPFDVLNALITLFGAFSLGVALFNLLPVPPLDGSRAWSVVPLLLRRAFRRRKPARRTKLRRVA